MIDVIMFMCVFLFEVCLFLHVKCFLLKHVNIVGDELVERRSL